jgi:hypothetical protein
LKGFYLVVELCKLGAVFPNLLIELRNPFLNLLVQRLVFLRKFSDLALQIALLTLQQLYLLLKLLDLLLLLFELNRGITTEGVLEADA